MIHKIVSFGLLWVFGLLRVLAFAAPADAAANLHAATLPDSRSVAIGDPATYFAVINNAGDAAATGCSIALSPFSSAPATLSYQTTDAANALVGTANTPANIAAGTSQNFLVSLTPSAAFSGTIKLAYACDGGVNAFNEPAVNDVILVAEAGTTPDIISIISSPSNDGVVRVATAGGVEAASISAINIGGGGNVDVTVTPSVSNFADLAALSICETNSSGTCTSATGASVDTTIGNVAKTFSVFVDAPDTGGVGLLPGYTRIKVDITEIIVAGDAPQKGTSKPSANTGILRGAASVAYTAPPTANAPAIPTGVYDFQIRDMINDPSGDFISGGQMVIAQDGSAMGWVKRIDAAPVIQVFQMTGNFFPNNPGGPIFGGDLKFLDTTTGVAGLDASLTFTYDSDASFLGRYSFKPPTDNPVGKLKVNKPEFLPTSNFLVYLGTARLALTYQSLALAALIGNYTATDPLTGASIGSATIDQFGILSGTLTPPGFLTACVLSGEISPIEALGILTLVDMQLAQCGVPPVTQAIAFNDPISFVSIQSIRMLLALNTAALVIDLRRQP